MEGLIEGRIVHYVLPDGPSSGEHRPAIVVKDWGGGNGCYNLIVFLDGSNDISRTIDAPASALTQWATSKVYSETLEPGTWHWPERK